MTIDDMRQRQHQNCRWQLPKTDPKLTAANLVVCRQQDTVVGGECQCNTKNALFE